MGMDIHVYMECKDNETGEWRYCGTYDIYHKAVYDYENRFLVREEEPTIEPVSVFTSRDYDLFSLLGETYRGSYQPAVPIHGKPSDMSVEVADMLINPETGKKYGYFGFNWVTMFELSTTAYAMYRVRKASKRDKHMWQTFKRFWTIIENAMYQSMNHVSSYVDTRIVYWFDN